MARAISYCHRPNCPFCIDRRNPPLRGAGLHLSQLVEPLGFEDQMDHRIGLEPNDEIRNVVVRLTVVEIGNGETESRIGCGTSNSLMGRVPSIDRPLYLLP